MDKLVFISGGSRGIGKALVVAFAQNGYKVSFSYCKEKQLAEDLIKTIGERCFAVKMDQSKQDQIETALDKTSIFFNQSIDVLVNNAAIAQEKPFSDITASDWASMLNTNLQGPFLLAQKVLPHMVTNHWGRIINISSIGGQWGGYNQVHYAASKAGLISLTQSIAKIYSLHGITSNTIAIGLAATDMSKSELASTAGQKKIQSIPCGRLGTPEEIAKICLFLASEDAAYLTGQSINPNGGMYFG